MADDHGPVAQAPVAEPPRINPFPVLGDILNRIELLVLLNSQMIEYLYEIVKANNLDNDNIRARYNQLLQTWADHQRWKDQVGDQQEAERKAQLGRPE